MRLIPQFLITAPASGSGKTTLARGLMALLQRHGLRVQPYKCGPDYIDVKFHTAVCRRPSVNLDSFMASADHVRALYTHYAKDADACVVEGMMGMYDGYDRDKGSSAEIARILGLPVVMVLDAKSAAYSVAPLLMGFLHFRKEIQIVGVIFNKVGSPRHFEMLNQVCEDLGIACLGYLPKRKDLEQGSRYLGLDFSQDNQSLDTLVDDLERFVNWRKLLELTSREFPQYHSSTLFSFPFKGLLKKADNHILVASNEESFSFIYQEHLDILRHSGTVSFFNPEEDVPIPAGIDLLYLPGGYPEKHLKELAEARQVLHSVKEYAENGGHILAECGGMMYLCQSVLHEEGETALTGILPYQITARKQDRKLSLGYRQLTYMGRLFKGHEFHYTQFYKDEPKSVAQVYNAKKEPVPTPFIKEKNVLGSYTHLYWGI